MNEESESRRLAKLAWPSPFKSQYQDKAESYVYFVACEVSPGVRHLKIGRSIDPASRVASMQTGNPAPLELLGCVRGGAELEKSLHRLFGPLRQGGEWFIYTDDIEALVGCLDFCKPAAVEEPDKEEQPRIALPVGTLKETTLIEFNGETRTLGECILIAAMQRRPSWR